MTTTLPLLNDEQMRQFIARGHLVLNNTITPEQHAAALEKVHAVLQNEGNPGNNILPRVPEIQEFFETPTVRGALTSILGEGYYMHPHRHCHYNQPGQETPQVWHKDGYWSSMRSHRPWWAILFYYTQDVTEEMGPTAIMSGSQYYVDYPGDYCPQLLPSGPAGTMVLVHFDLWHRASLNQSQIDRYMLKFQFIRLHEPSTPNWDHDPAQAVPDFSGLVPEAAAQPLIYEDVWYWLMGQSANRPTDAADHAEPLNLSALTEALSQSHEPSALHAAYALARSGEQGNRALLQALEHGSESAALHAAYALPSAGIATLPGLSALLTHRESRRRGLAAFAIGILGSQATAAVPALIALLADPAVWVRRVAAEALGQIAQPAAQIVPALEAIIRGTHLPAEETADPSRQPYIKDKAGYAAVLSMLRLGASDAARRAVPTLRLALQSPDRYVRAYASEALTHIRSDEAVSELIRYYRTSRWCADTHAASTF